MRLIKSFFTAFSVYSKIPVPGHVWKEEDMGYVFCFFPWVGAVLGACVYFWNDLCGRYQIGTLCRAAAALVIPVFLTGGIHADGFIDTMDALHSYQPKERKLEILKDSHIGAFALIMSAVYGLVYIGMFSEIKNDALVKTACSGFFLSRCLCGISVVSFPLAKQDGMLAFFAGCAEKKIVNGALSVQGAACVGLMYVWAGRAGLFAAAAALAAFVYYYYRSRKAFGGITGDTSGYFILLCEAGVITAAAAASAAGR